MRQDDDGCYLVSVDFEDQVPIGKGKCRCCTVEKERRRKQDEFEIDVRRSDLGSARLLLQPELPEYKWGRITKDIVVKLPSVSTGYDAIRV
ncbi:hypothetical protein Tco_1082372 [Tanacetum coccineum]|uniref:Uncharacterized protein n=1 Tax=Tanacetum coccineum TaxID=301880 RepID=A0ABQ5I0B8_9ASTR